LLNKSPVGTSMSLFEVSKFMSIVNVTPDLSNPAVSVSLLFNTFQV
jgi:hypothetical protein